MEVAAAAMRPLTRKLGELLVGELKLDKRVRKGVKSLETEPTLMHAALVKVPPDQLDTGIKVWAGKVRDLSYRVEDVVDFFMVGLGGAPAPIGPDTFPDPQSFTAQVQHSVRLALRCSGCSKIIQLWSCEINTYIRL